MCIKKTVLKCFPRVGVVNITDPERGPTATGMILESSTAKKSCPPHRLINGTDGTDLDDFEILYITIRFL